MLNAVARVMLDGLVSLLRSFSVLWNCRVDPRIELVALLFICRMVLLSLRIRGRLLS